MSGVTSASPQSNAVCKSSDLYSRKAHSRRLIQMELAKKSVKLFLRSLNNRLILKLFCYNFVYLQVMTDLRDGESEETGKEERETANEGNKIKDSGQVTVRERHQARESPSTENWDGNVGSLFQQWATGEEQAEGHQVGPNRWLSLSPLSL